MDWWDWFVRKGRAGDVVYGRSYWSTAHAGRTMHVIRGELQTIGLDGVE